MFDIATDQMMTMGDIIHYLKVSRSTLERLRKHASFPKPVLIIRTSPRWSQKEIHNYVFSSNTTQKGYVS